MYDKISFREFLDIKDSDTIPDEAIVCKFREALIEANLFEYIFNIVKNEMIKNNLIIHEGTLVDATFIHSSEPKRKEDSPGRVISNKANKNDASYTSKRGRKHHDNKVHIATDSNSIIKGVITTTAKARDSTQFEELTKDESRAVFATALKEVPLGCSGYMSQERKRKLRKEGISNGITERRVSGQSKLGTKQSKNNTQFSKVIALAELPFAFIKYTWTRYLGIKKNSQHVFMVAVAYNLRWIPNLKLKMM